MKQMNGYDKHVETKAQVSPWVGESSPRKKKTKKRQCRAKVEMMLIVFFDWMDIVHHKFVPHDQLYLKAMERLREAVRRKGPEERRNKVWMLYLDNTHAHSSLIVHEFLAKHEMAIVPQLPYSRFGSWGLKKKTPEVKIAHWKSPISNDRSVKRNFATWPTHHSRKRIPGTVMEMEKKLEAVYRGEVWLSKC